MSRKRRLEPEAPRRRSPRLGAQLTLEDSYALDSLSCEEEDDDGMSLNLVCTVPPAKRKQQPVLTEQHPTIAPRVHSARLPGPRKINQSGCNQRMPWQNVQSFNEELAALQRYVKLSVREQHAREAMFAQLRDACSLLWPEAEIELYGSAATGNTLIAAPVTQPSALCSSEHVCHAGLDTFCSDIDICIRHASGKPRNNVRKLATTLKEVGWAGRVEARTNAKVPIVYVVHRDTGVEADVSFDNSKVNHGTQLQRAAAAKFAPLRPITVLLKLMLKYANLYKPWSGGMSNFKLVCLVVDMLQRQRTNDPATALKWFLQRYSSLQAFSKQLQCKVGKVSVMVETGPTSIRRLAECVGVFGEARDAAMQSDGQQLVPQLIPIDLLIRDRDRAHNLMRVVRSQ